MAVKVIIRQEEQIIEYTVNQTVQKVFKRVNLLPEAYLCVREGELLTEKETLKDGDIIRLVPVISGG